MKGSEGLKLKLEECGKILKASVELLEEDENVLSFEYEPRIALPDESWILPDFLVERKNTRPLLVEVKAHWVFEYKDNEEKMERLKKSEMLCWLRGWDYSVWTEETYLKDVI